MKSRNIRTDLYVLFLFFALLVVGFIFACTDAEYEYNQQIARGFISRESIFFSFDNLSYKEAFYGRYVFREGEYDESFNMDTTPKVAKDESFVLENKILDNGQTAVESLLSFGSGSYLASLHSGVLRGVVYKGQILLPPLLSGRFLTAEECLLDEPLAVIGQDYKSLTFSFDGKEYLEYSGKKYEVIGVIGLSADSPLDNIIFVNIGSLTPEEQLNGIYFVDCSVNNGLVFAELNDQSKSLFGCELIRRETPTAFIDVVAGGMYMKTYLKTFMLLLGLITFLNVLIQVTRELFIEISVMKIQGIHFSKMFAKTTKKSVVAAVSGMILGIAADVGLIARGVFSLPIMWIIRYCATMIFIGLLLLLLWILYIFIVERKLDIKGIVQRI